MAREEVNVGLVANDGTGDPIRNAFIKVNNMTYEIYAAFGDGTNLSGYVTTDASGDLNRIATWSSTNEVVGRSNFTFDGSTLKVGDTVSVESTLTPTLALYDSLATAAFAKTALVRDGDNGFRINTTSNNNSLVSTDYEIDVNASGASQHMFRVANQDRFAVAGTTATLSHATSTHNFVLENGNMQVKRAATGDLSVYFMDSTNTVQGALTTAEDDTFSLLGPLPTDGITTGIDRSSVVFNADGTVEFTYSQPDGDQYLAVMDYTNSTDLPSANSIVTKGRISAAIGSLTTDDVSEGSNLYYTETRFDTSLAAKTTDDVAEGTTNLYFTDATAETFMETYLVAGTGITLDISTPGFMTINGSSTLASTDDLAEGTVNFYYTDARFDTGFAAKTTDDLAQGTTNLYYSNERVLDYLSGTTTPGEGLVAGSGITFTYDDGAGTLTIDAVSGSVDLSGNDTDDLAEGTTNLYYTDARAQAAFTAGTGVDITTGTISIGQAVGLTDDVTFNDVIVDGNLTVNGTTTTVNSTTVEIGDNIILLNSDETGTPSQDAGFEIERGTEANVSFVWDETNDRWSTGGEDLAAGTFFGTFNGTFTGTPDLSGNTTDDLAQGTTNLYYADSLVETFVASYLVEGTNVTLDTTTTPGSMIVNATTSLVGSTTDDLAEGTTNLYYDDALARAALSGGTGITYDSVTGEISVNAAEITWDGGDVNNDINLITSNLTFEKDTGAAAITFYEGLTPTLNTAASITSLANQSLNIQGANLGGAFRMGLLMDATTGTVTLTKTDASGANPFYAVMDYTTSTDLPTSDSVVTAGRIDTALEGATFKGYKEHIEAAGSASITADASVSNIYTRTLTAATTINNFSSPLAGQSVTYVLTQDATGGRTISFPAAWKFANADDSVSTSANVTDIITVFYDGTSYYASISKGFDTV